MKRSILMLAICSILLAGAMAQTFNFEKEISLISPNPYACAVDSNGGLYYVTFDEGNSGLFYIADPVNDDSNVVSVTVTPPAPFPASRGLQGCAVDSTGNVYVSGDLNLNSSFVRKYGPAPTFTPDATFAPTADSRLLGCAMYDDDYIMVTTFNSVRFYATADGSYLNGLYVDNANNYQRDLAYNPSNNDIYASRNGGNNPGSVVIWSGGSAPDDLVGYTRPTLTFVDNTQESSQYGTGGQGIGFYAPLNLMLVNVDVPLVTPPEGGGTMDIYSVTGTGAAAAASLVTSLDGYDETGTQLGSALDAVMHDYSGTVRLYITDTANDRILVYKIPSSATSLAADPVWSIYE